jgi:hypothetical protein
MSNKPWLFLLVSFFLLGMQTPPQAEPRLLSPQPGSAVQGSLTINGSTDVPNFQYAEISFSYSAGQNESWFLIQQLRTPIKEGPLTVWDTTTIADGNYRLRLQVFLTDGKILETILPGLRVRNYSTIETSTPTSIQAVTRPAASATVVISTPTPRPTPTLLPTNPVQVPPARLGISLAIGVGISVVFFIGLAFYQAVRKQG